MNYLKQRKENDEFLNLPDDLPFPKHITELLGIFCGMEIGSNTCKIQLWSRITILVHYCVCKNRKAIMSTDGTGVLADLNNDHLHVKTLHNIASLNPKYCFDDNLLDCLKLSPHILIEFVSNTNRDVDVRASISQFISDIQSAFSVQPMSYPIMGLSDSEISF